MMAEEGNESFPGTKKKIPCGRKTLGRSRIQRPEIQTLFFFIYINAFSKICIMITC